MLIVEARLSKSPDLVLNVVKRRINRVRNEIHMLTYRADPQETKEALLIRAAQDIASSTQSQKSEEAAIARTTSGGERSKIMVLASISTLRAWTDIRARLTAMPMVDRIELVAMSPQQVDMVLHYRGQQDSLATAIEAQKLRLNKTNPSYWVISRD
jgi:plasmid stability protein